MKRKIIDIFIKEIEQSDYSDWDAMTCISIVRAVRLLTEQETEELCAQIDLVAFKKQENTTGVYN